MQKFTKLKVKLKFKQFCQLLNIELIVRKNEELVLSISKWRVEGFINTAVRRHRCLQISKTNQKASRVQEALKAELHATSVLARPLYLTHVQTTR